MHTRRSSSLLLLYGGTLAASLVVIGGGLLMVVQASAALSSPTPRDKTVLETRIESAREIRHSLAQPVTIAPLPPITARPARQAVPLEAKVRRLPSAEAMNAMAMAPGHAAPAGHAPAPKTAPDRLTGGGW